MSSSICNTRTLALEYFYELFSFYITLCCFTKKEEVVVLVGEEGVELGAWVSPPVAFASPPGPG